MEQAASTPRPARSPGGLDRSLDATILDAALAGVAEQGFDRLSMDDIASRAGVGKAAIYRRWPSKAVVVADAIAHWRRRLGPVEPPNTGSLRGDIDALIAAQFRSLSGWRPPRCTIPSWQLPWMTWCSPLLDRWSGRYWTMRWLAGR